MQWVLRLLAKTYKYFNNILPPYMAYSQNMIRFSYG
jgi:hypothetical protein